MEGWVLMGKNKELERIVSEGYSGNEVETPKEVELNEKLCRDGGFGGPHYHIDSTMDTEIGMMILAQKEKGHPPLKFYSEDGRNHWLSGYVWNIPDHAIIPIGQKAKVVVRGEKTFLKRWNTQDSMTKGDSESWYYIDINNVRIEDDEALRQFLSSDWKKYRGTYEAVTDIIQDMIVGQLPKTLDMGVIEVMHDQGWLENCDEYFGVEPKRFIEILAPGMLKGFLVDWFEKVYEEYPRMEMEKSEFFTETLSSFWMSYFSGTTKNYRRIVWHNMNSGYRPNSPKELFDASTVHIPDHHVLRKLGEGSFKKVYLAESLISKGLQLAFKIINPNALGKDLIEKHHGSMKKWLGGELYITELKEIDSPYVTKVYEPIKIKDDGHLIKKTNDSVDKNFLYCLVEDPFRVSLADLIEEGTLDLEESVLRAFHMASGLNTCHKKGVIHKDLKPSNVGVGFDGLTKLTDFGTLKSIDRKDGLREITSLAYSPLSVIQGEDVDERANMFSVGIMLWEMVRGSNPFTPDYPKPKGPCEEKDVYNNKVVTNIEAFTAKSLKERNEYILDDLQAGKDYALIAISAVITAATADEPIYSGFDDLRRDLSGVLGQYRQKKDVIFTLASTRDSENIGGGVQFKSMSGSMWEKVITDTMIGPIAVLDSYKDVMVPMDYEYLKERLTQLQEDSNDAASLKTEVKRLNDQINHMNQTQYNMRDFKKW